LGQNWDPRAGQSTFRRVLLYHPVARPPLYPAQRALPIIVSNPFSSATGTASSWGPILAGIALVLLPTVDIFLVMQRYVIRGAPEGSVK
jgi:ABC-type glycerol-3-phosphate transport system permease component